MNDKIKFKNNIDVTKLLKIDRQKFYGSHTDENEANCAALTFAFIDFIKKFVQPVTETMRLSFENIIQELGHNLPKKVNHTSQIGKKKIYSMIVEVIFLFRKKKLEM